MSKTAVCPASGSRRRAPGSLGALLSCALAVLAAGLAAPALAGTLRDFAYRSASLGRAQVAEVYVPDGAAPETGWPVLYLLHGLNGAPTDWETLGGIRGTMDRLIAQRTIRPMVVVMPQGANSWYVDSADVSGPGNYASAIAHDLPKAIETAFPVGRDRAHRAIAGLSMGGFGAFRIALSEPDRYVAAAAMSPAIWQNVPDDIISKSPREMAAIRSTAYFKPQDPATVTVGVDLPPEGQHFGGAFGTPFDARRFNDENVFTLLRRQIDGKADLPRLFMTVGDDDSHQLWRGAIALFETMQMNRRAIEFRVTDGDHDWHCWKRATVETLAFVDRAFAGDITQ